MKENSIEEDMKTLEEIIKANEDCINAIYSQMKVQNDDNEDIQYFKKEIQSIKNIVNNYLKEKSRADKLEKEYKHYKRFESISIQKVKDIIDRIDYDIKKTKEIISKNTNIYASYRKNDYQIVRLRAMNTKSLDIKKRLQKLLESEK